MGPDELPPTNINGGEMDKDYKIKDTGEHREFDTGARRDNKENKGRFDLLSWRTIRALAVHYEKGANKYEDRNWEKGIPIAEFIDSGLRHAGQFIEGLTDENHLIAAIWNLVGAYETLERIKAGILPKELDDLPYTYREDNKEEDNKDPFPESPCRCDFCGNKEKPK